MTAMLKRKWSRQRVEWAELGTLSRKPFGDNWRIASSLHHIIPALLILNQFLGGQYLHHFHSFPFYTLRTLFPKFKIVC